MRALLVHIASLDILNEIRTNKMQGVDGNGAKLIDDEARIRCGMQVKSQRLLQLMLHRLQAAPLTSDC